LNTKAFNERTKLHQLIKERNIIEQESSEKETFSETDALFTSVDKEGNKKTLYSDPELSQEDKESLRKFFSTEDENKKDN